MREVMAGEITDIGAVGANVALGASRSRVTVFFYMGEGETEPLGVQVFAADLQGQNAYYIRRIAALDQGNAEATDPAPR